MSIRPEGVQPGGFAPPGLRLQTLQSEDVPERDRLEPRLLLVERKREQVTILGMAEDRRQQNQLLALIINLTERSESHNHVRMKMTSCAKMRGMHLAYQMKNLESQTDSSRDHGNLQIRRMKIWTDQWAVQALAEAPAQEIQHTGDKHL